MTSSFLYVRKIIWKPSLNLIHFMGQTYLKIFKLTILLRALLSVNSKRNWPNYLFLFTTDGRVNRVYTSSDSVLFLHVDVYQTYSYLSTCTILQKPECQKAALPNNHTPNASKRQEKALFLIAARSLITVIAQTRR